MLGIGVKEIEPSKKGFSYMPKMWLTRLDVKTPEGDILDAELWVNRPFRTGGLTLYQMGYEQKISLAVHAVNGNDLRSFSDEADNEIVNVEVRSPFQIKGIEGRFVLGSLKLGTLFKRNGEKEKINPVTTLYYIPEEKSRKKEVIGELHLGENLKVKDRVFEFLDYREASYLSYRKDPGVWLVGLACLFVFLGLFIRCFGAWYRVQYATNKRTSYVLLSTRGILADKDRIIKKLQR